jgi:hypothetical protein
VRRVEELSCADESARVGVLLLLRGETGAGVVAVLCGWGSGTHGGPPVKGWSRSLTLREWRCIGV